MHHMLVIIQALPAWPGSDSICNACGSGDAAYMGVSIGQAPKQNVWFQFTIFYNTIFGTSGNGCKQWNTSPRGEGVFY